MPDVEYRSPYEVIVRGDRFAFPTFREMAAFARSLERRRITVLYCQMRAETSSSVFKRSAWDVR